MRSRIAWSIYFNNEIIAIRIYFQLLKDCLTKSFLLTRIMIQEYHIISEQSIFALIILVIFYAIIL
jgi:hypothetical protein